MWEETIEADTIKKLVIRIIRIVVYEIRLMLNYPIRYALDMRPCFPWKSFLNWASGYC